MADATKTLQVVIDAKDNASRVIKSLGETFGGLVRSSEAGSIAFAGALTFTGKKIIDVASTMEQAKVSFDVMLGSSEKASKSLKQLSDFAKITPFTFPQVVEGARQLLAYGFGADDLTKNLRTLGDVASGVGAPLSDVVYLYGTLRAQGRAYTRDIIQFAQRGIPIYEELAKVLGVDTMQVKDLVESGKVGFPEVEKAFQNMTSQGSKFGGLMDRQSQTLKGITSNISDQLVRIALNIAGISTEAETFGQVIKGGAFDKFEQAAQKILDVLNQLEPKVKSFLDTFLNNQAAIYAVLGGLAGALLGAAVAMWAFLGPVIILAALGAAVAVGIYFIYQAIQNLIPIIQNLWQSWTTAFAGIITAVSGFITSVVAWFAGLPAQVMVFLNQLVTVDIPFAIAFLVGFLTTAIPGIINSIIGWWQALPGIILGIMIMVVQFIIGQFIAAWAWVSSNVSTWPGKIEGFLKNLPNLIKAILDTLFNVFKSVLGGIWDFIVGWKDRIVGAFNAIVDAVERAINAIRRGFEAGQKAGKGISFQHGGFVPGAFNQAVPAILHGGERVIPRNGVDVNPGNTFNGGITVNMTGPVTMDSPERIDQLANAIIRILGRQNELAAKGVSF